ncbi:MAG: proton-conducting transporter transmembrane domain-containing protein [Myxococcales bacterium]
MNAFLGAETVLVVGGALAFAASARPAWALRLGSLSALAGSAWGLWAALAALASKAPVQVALGGWAPAGPIQLRLDALGAFFELPVFALGALGALYGLGYLRHAGQRRSLGAALFAYDLLIASMALVAAADGALLFLFSWELMSISSYVLVTFEHEDEQVRSAGRTYLFASQLSGACLFALFFALGRHAGGLDFSRLAALRLDPSLRTWPYLALAFAGFGTKAGLVPLHVWLPEAHPAAPSHVSALMSGAMTKIGLYGLLRTLSFLPPPPLAFGLCLGAVGLGGALFAIVQALGERDVKRVLAYSTIENVGIVTLALGTGFVGLAEHAPALAALGFAGALLHVWNHALGKGLLFMGAGAMVQATGTRDAERMGGLLARLPRTGSLFVFGAAVLAGLPPLSCFVSEWLVYLGLFGGAGTLPRALPGVAALAGVGLALIGALAAIAFTRLAGVALLGQPRTAAAARAHEPGLPMVAAMALAAAGCLAVALAPAFFLRIFAPAAAALAEVSPAALLLQLGPTFQTLSGPWPALVLGLAGGAALLSLLRRLLDRRAEPRRDTTWGCGYPAPTPRMQYGAAAFSQLVQETALPRLLRPARRELRPDGPFPSRAWLHTEPADPALRRLFEPLFAGTAARFTSLRSWQAGRLDVQLVYPLAALFALAALLWLGPWT